jgi:secernin
MCDTMAVVKSDGVLFAKNSDRDANEAQHLEWLPRREYGAGARVRCTHIEIPQARETYAVLLSRPFWIWGAEMGSNEFGVTIGNEAVFTKQPYAKTGLLGMDLIRLALERSANANAAVETITALLEEFGQGGGAGLEHRSFTYHNSFIVADPMQAFVLETAGKKWAVEEVKGARSISNGLTIQPFADEQSDFLKTRFSGCGMRRARTQGLLRTDASVEDLIQILSDHGDGSDAPNYSMINGGLNAPCVHGGGLIAASQTTSSWVADLRPGAVRHWVTGTSAPCISLFKPVYVEQPVDLGVSPAAMADDSLWWRHEQLHRAMLKNPENYRRLFADERARVQTEWLRNPPESAAAFKRGDELLAKWTAAVATNGAEDLRPGFVRRYWDRRNRAARFSLR